MGVTSSDDDEFVQTTISRKNPVSNHRVVQKSSPRKVGFDQELPTKRSAFGGQRSVMSRLGAKVSDDSEEDTKKRLKIQISGDNNTDEDEFEEEPASISLSKKEKKE